MAALDFPPSPVVGDKYPVTPVPGTPQYTWDGEKWTTTGAQVTSASPSNNLPLMDATPAVPGVGTQYSREDHVHPTDTSRAADTAVLKKVPQSLTVTEQTDVRKNVYAAPLDALAYSGMQVNGSMDVSQELGATGRAGVGYIRDGWYHTYAGTMVLAGGVSAIAPGFTNAIYVNVGTAQASLGAGDFAYLVQTIEGYRIARLAWGTANAQPITIAFWTRHKRTGLYTVLLRNAGNNRSYAATYTHAVADVAQYNVITIPGCTDGTWLSDNSAGMLLAFVTACGTTYTAPSANTWLNGLYVAAPGQVNAVAATTDIQIFTGVVVLPGIEAPSAARSPLIMRPYDQELVTCRRYFQQIGGTSNYEVVGLGQAYASGNAQTNTFFDYPMRTAPTCTATGSFGVHSAAAGPTATTGIVQIAATTTQSVINITVAAGLIAGDSTKLTTNNDLNARIKFDARL